MKKSTTALGIVTIAALVAAAGALIYAFTQETEQRTTGGFTIGDQTDVIDVLLFNTASLGDGDTTADAEGAWCAVPDLSQTTEWYCGARVHNQTSSDISYSMATSNVSDPALAAAINLEVLVAPGNSKTATAPGCGDGWDGTQVVSPTLLSDNPSFGDPAPGVDAGDRTILAPDPLSPAGDRENLCFKFTFNGGVFNATTTATFDFVGEQP